MFRISVKNVYTERQREGEAEGIPAFAKNRFKSRGFSLATNIIVTSANPRQFSSRFKRKRGNT